MGRKLLAPNTLLLPTPVVLVTSVDEAGKPNIITLAWAGVVNSEPPMLGISIRPSRYSHRCIQRSGEFVVNLASEEMIRKLDACGIVSGKDVDKFSLTKWKPVPGHIVKTPLIEESPLQMECQVKQALSLGSHDLFIGQVVAVHVKEEVLGEKDRIDIARFLPVVYCPGAREYWNLGKPMGSYGFTKGKP